MTRADGKPEVLDQVLPPEDPRWKDEGWVNGFLPSGVPFRWRRLVCQAEGCRETALTCAVEGEAGHWNYIFTPESDFVVDMSEDSLYCEAHTQEV
jgi:hypothetical protein